MHYFFSIPLQPPFKGLESGEVEWREKGRA
jgi:hypothetical protein